MHGRRRASRPRRPSRPEPAHRPPARVHERSHVQRRQIERHRRARVIRRRRSRREIDHARRRGDDAPSHDGVPRGHVPAADATARARRAIALHEGWIRIAHQRPRDDRRRRHRARARARWTSAHRASRCASTSSFCAERAGSSSVTRFPGTRQATAARATRAMTTESVTRGAVHVMKMPGDAYRKQMDGKNTKQSASGRPRARFLAFSRAPWCRIRRRGARRRRTCTWIVSRRALTRAFTTRSRLRASLDIAHHACETCAYEEPRCEPSRPMLLQRPQSSHEKDRRTARR